MDSIHEFTIFTNKHIQNLKIYKDYEYWRNVTQKT